MTSIGATSSGTASSSATPPSSSSATTNGGSFNEDNLMRKLDNCTPTQESIQTLALWIMHHKSSHEIITKLWLRKMSEATLNAKHRLALVYLANDVIQNCKRKNAKVYHESFKSVLGQAIVHCRSDAIKKNIERVLDVWLERQVYDKEFVTKLIASLNFKSTMLARSPDEAKTEKPEEHVVVEKTDEYGKDDIERIITEFQPKQLCDSISDFQTYCKQLSSLKTEIESTRILDISLEHVKQYRDRSQCARFKLEFENSCEKLEQYVAKLNEQLDKRKHLVKLMQQSEIFYDAQYKDAKTVFNAYRSYGTKVHAVKKKIDELIDTKFSNSNKNLDNLDMEMSDDDQNAASSSQPANSQSSLTSLLQNSSLQNKHAQSSQVRTNLDPRQNRTTKQRDDTKRRDRSNTPVRDENPDNNSSSSNNSPLDFLTKFINKSSNQNETPQATSTQQTNSNLSFLVNSLQKFVNNGNSSGGPGPSGGGGGGGYSQQNEFYNPAGINYQSTFMSQEQNRPGTPTKDEVSYPQPILIPQTQPPTYNPMMVSPPPPPYPMYQPTHMIPPPPMVPPGQLMIDPYHHLPYQPAPPPGYYPTPNKVLISPPAVSPQQISPLMGVSQPAKSPKSNWNERKSEPPKTEGYNPTPPKRPLLSNPILTGPATPPVNKRKFSSFDDGQPSSSNNQVRFKPFQHANNSGHTNRIPTINSQRDRGEQQTGGGPSNTNNFNNRNSRFY